MTAPAPLRARPAGEPDCLSEWREQSAAAGAARSGEFLAATASGDHLAMLLRTVENEVIPRLVMLHRRTGVSCDVSAATGEITEQCVVEFTDALLGGYEAAQDAVARFVDRGVSPDTVFLDLFAPTARRLGDLWSADRCEFTEVTIGLWRLQQLLHRFCGDSWPPESARIVHSALLSSVPGEQHSFGVSIVAEFFRHAGWMVREDSFPNADAVVRLVGSEHFDIVGFSLGSQRHVQALTDLIARVRKQSRNRSVGVLVGGPLLVAKPSLVSQLGADATAVDARQAMLRAESLVAVRDWHR